MYFIEEKALIDKLKEKINRNEFTGNPLVSDFNNILSDYAKNLDETERLIQISDILQKNLNHINQRLQAANEMRSQLIDLAIHDLKNPLSIIICYLDILEKNGNLDSAWQEIVNKMHKSARGMCEFITDLLSTERIGEETILLRLSQVNLIDLMNTVIANNQLRLDNKKQLLNFKYQKNHELIVKADKLLLAEICDNLLSNAIKYSPRRSQIDITAELVKDENQTPVVHISFKDQGPGFSESDKKRLFQKFQRLSADPTGDESSTGLGLFITKKLIDLHDGRIWLQSNGEGSTFIVELKI